MCGVRVYACRAGICCAWAHTPTRTHLHQRPVCLPLIAVRAPLFPRFPRPPPTPHTAPGGFRCSAAASASTTPQRCSRPCRWVGGWSGAPGRRKQLQALPAPALCAAVEAYGPPRPPTSRLLCNAREHGRTFAGCSSPTPVGLVGLGVMHGRGASLTRGAALRLGRRRRLRPCGSGPCCSSTAQRR